MENPATSSRAGWVLALVIIAAPLLLVAGSWSQITAGGEEGLEPGRLEVAAQSSPKNGDSYIRVVP